MKATEQYLHLVVVSILCLQGGFESVDEILKLLSTTFKALLLQNTPAYFAHMKNSGFKSYIFEITVRSYMCEATVLLHSMVQSPCFSLVINSKYFI